MTQAGDGKVGADVVIRFGFKEIMRVEKDEVADRRMELGVQVGHHVRQVEMFARHYYLYTNQLSSTALKFIHVSSNLYGN